jgi:uncharacterized surface protein with fasciclin (FAS1) repeats
MYAGPGIGDRDGVARYKEDSMKTMTMKLSVLGSVFAMVLLLLTGCGDSDDVSGQASDATDRIDEAVPDDATEAQSSFAELLRDIGASSAASAVEEVDISALTDSEEYTFLAPNDDAFRSVSSDELADLLADPERLIDVLRNHTIAERLSAEELAERTEVTSELGTTLPVSSSDGTITVGDATVVDAGLIDGGQAGVIHTVDRFLLPE